MARKSTVWLRECDGYYYTTIRGEQIKLSRDKGAAEREFHRRLGEEPGPVPRDEACVTLAALVKAFLEDGHKKNTADTYKCYKRFLLGFVKSVGRVKVRELRPYMAYRWVEAHVRWCPTTRRNALAMVEACLNWAVRQGYLKDHPLKRLDKPSAERRKGFITPEQREQIFNRLPGGSPFRHYLFALADSGCRPGEAAKVRAEDFDAAAGVWVIAEHKNRRKTGKPRVIYLTPTLVELSKQLSAACGGTGPLFRNKLNRPWKPSTVEARMRKLGRELGIPGLCAYHFRHAYITLALEKGMSDSVVAELCGNSPQTIAKNYSHLGARVQAMRDAARRAVE